MDGMRDDGRIRTRRAARRRERTDGKIMRAAMDLVTTRGVGAVTIEAVARLSGVAKTTIYRRYANTEDLLRHLSMSVTPSIDFSGLEPSRESLHTALLRVVDAFDGELGLKAVGVVLSSDNAHLHGFAGRVIRPAAERFADFLDRGVDAGVFRDGLNVPFLFQTVLGSMVACEAMDADDEDPARAHAAWADAMTDLLWPTLRA